MVTLCYSDNYCQVVLMPRKKTKLCREQWLKKAMNALAKSGGCLNIDDLVATLGVTKGSFYWHFKNREAFVKEVIDYWFHQYTENASHAANSIDGTPQDKLFALMMHIQENNLNQYDIAFRSWGAREPKLANKIKKVDTFRLNYVRSLFKEMGFQGSELEMRTRMFVVYQGFETFIFDKPDKQLQLKLLKKQHTFLITKS